MIVGASLGSFINLTLERAIKLYLKLSDEFGLKAVELRFEKDIRWPSLWHWEVDNRIRCFLERFEVVGVHLPFIYINPISPNTKIREESIKQLKEAMTKAAEVGATYTVMHANGLFLGFSKERQFDEWFGIINELASYAEEKSLLLTVENADFLWNLADLAKIVKKINSPWLKITFDIGHAHMRKVPSLQEYPLKELFLRISDAILPSFLFKKNMPYEEYNSIENFVRAEKEFIYAIHVHDYNGRRDHLPIGEGKINFSFLSELKDFKGPWIFEVKLFKNYYENFAKSYNKFMKLMNK